MIQASETLLLPQPGRRTATSRGATTGLPADLLDQSAARLRAVSLLYAFVVFMAGVLPAKLVAPPRAAVLARARTTAPGAAPERGALLLAHGGMLRPRLRAS